MAVTGCTTTNETPSTTTGGTITVAEVNEVTSFNPNTPQGNLDMNAKLTGYTRSGFFYLDDKLNIIPDKSFGTVEKTSDDPLTVKYTLAKTATWSDGTPVTADDMMLAWAVQSGFFNDSTTDADGNVTSGTTYFDYAGDTSGLGLADKPVVGDDNTSITLTYSEPYADWQLINPIDAPAHVVADHAGVALKDVMSAMQTMPRGDAAKPAAPNDALKTFADFWNTGFDATSLPTDKTLYLSSAGMVLDSWVPKQSITLVRNPDYKGDLKPKVDKIVVRFIGDAQAQVTALQNGEVDIINPQASADTIKSLEALKNVTTLTGNQFSYDHLDISFNTKVFKDANVRKAFLMTVPRQQILDAIVTPQNPDATLDDSQLFFPGTDAYDAAIKVNGSSAYDKVDIDGAKALLAGATPEVRVLYNTKNPNRVASFQALQASAAKAGFKVIDGGAENWGSLLGSGTYDASIFGWISSGVGVAGVPQIFSTKGGGNYSGYSNAQVDSLAKQLQVTLDKKAQDDIQTQIDTLLWGDGYGVPLFVAPGVMANSNNVTGVVYYPGQAGVGWNYWEWAKK
ncbi:peptide/nickel transport system substrate-binding protein [Cryobacterium mesophilum]|uniref:ABC transporter family substrate-binding protein n=1 Tax=Terrimesophilobacter mesophilus TaxID=433647 RepID=A0A4V3I9R6_9MICO|nr:ABC transporter family substrate-binding protein [Terrimesophilobacter mesophilus]MBB5633819.1 peptide/nickel transport system substrate-binding protein [Terrimesophilobacter mesophilus]TFB80498.1 ABC transporter family substrate-binding protein [Terrimesophilobacter mesophilus]